MDEKQQVACVRGGGVEGGWVPRGAKSRGGKSHRRGRAPKLLPLVVGIEEVKQVEKVGKKTR